MTKIVVSGKRKSAIARAVITKGDGKIVINNKNYKNFQEFDKLSIEEPLRIFEHIIGKPDFDIQITVNGGGNKGQIEASRLALARAINKFTKSKKLENAFTEYDRNLLIADVRRKETYKPMDSKARAKRQSSKR
ncbi:MAG TPA: 30S ribosomal protein S9 [Candidatus Nanoarchaeia archaeon]|nr:30S ribosomal protein S9 [Candidatus Nanoarchaeia archaeon]